MSRLWLVVIESADETLDAPEVLDAYLKDLFEGGIEGFTVRRVSRGGLLAKMVLEELPPVRHALMGRRRG